MFKLLWEHKFLLVWWRFHSDHLYLWEKKFVPIYDLWSVIEKWCPCSPSGEQLAEEVLAVSAAAQLVSSSPGTGTSSPRHTHSPVAKNNHSLCQGLATPCGGTMQDCTTLPVLSQCSLPLYRFLSVCKRHTANIVLLRGASIKQHILKSGQWPYTSLSNCLHWLFPISEICMTPNPEKKGSKGAIPQPLTVHILTLSLWR